MKLQLLAALFVAALCGVFALDPIPGLDSAVGRGFDVVQGETRAPIINFHYTFGNTWTNPFTGAKYSVPDEFTVTNSPSGTRRESNEIIRQIHEYVNMRNSWSSFSIGIPGFLGFGKSKQQGHVQELLNEGKNTIFFAYRKFAMYEMNMWPYSILEGQSNSRFAQMVNRLPYSRSTDEEKQAYRSFIQVYGTHYSPRAKFGGEANYMCAVSNEFMMKKTTDWVSKQASLYIKLMDIGIGISKGSNSTDIHIDKEFKENMKVKDDIRGGNFLESNPTAWLDSIGYNPVILDPTLAEISELMPDPKRSALLHDAIYEYLQENTKKSQMLEKFMSNVVSTSSGGVLPGIDAGIARGYDIVTEMIRAPLVRWNYEFAQTWKSPYTGLTYDIPDELFVTNVAQSSSTKFVGITDTWSQHYKYKSSSINFKIGVGFDIGGVGLEASLAFGRSKTEVSSYLKANYNQFGLDNHYISYFQLDLWPGSDFDPRFQMMIKALPAGFSTAEERAKYGQLIRGYGTHYVSTAQFGGFVNVTTVFDKALVEKYGASWVSTQVGIALKYGAYSLGIDYGKNNTDVKNDRAYTENSKTFAQYIGGIPDVLESQGYKAWIATILSNPVMVPAKTMMFPISELMPDSVRKNNMLQALRSYVTTGTV